MRLDKFICKSTEYELTQAINLVESERLKVNGLTVTDRSIQVYRNTVVKLDKRVLIARDSRYFVCHKPLDTVGSNINDHYPSILQLLDVDRLNELHIVDRLDVNTTGLILITDDGHWSYH